MNHKAECLIIVPIPNRSYYETRTVCVCDLRQVHSFNTSDYAFESSFEKDVRPRDFHPSDKDSEPNPNYSE